MYNEDENERKKNIENYEIVLEKITKIFEEQDFLSTELFKDYEQFKKLLIRDINEWSERLSKAEETLLDWKEMAMR